MGQLSPAFFEGWRYQPPFRGHKAKPRSKNVDHLLYLVAFEEGFSDRVDTVVFKWDKKQRLLEAWNQDHSMKSALRSSCVWCFKEIHHYVGKDKYFRYMDDWGFGKNPVNDKLKFDLDFAGGSVSISSIEHIDFLRRIYKHAIKAKAISFDLLKDSMLEEVGGTYRLYSKTGAMLNDKWQGTGRYVGYVESKNDVWLFAIDIESNSFDDLLKRKQILLKSLRIKGII